MICNIIKLGDKFEEAKYKIYYNNINNNICNINEYNCSFLR